MLSGLHAQFLDMATPVQLDFRILSEKTADAEYQQKLAADITFDVSASLGIIFRIQSADTIQIRCKFKNSEGDWSALKNMDIYREPFSDRYYAVYKGQEISSLSEIELFILSSSNVSILHSGLILHEEEDQFQGSELTTPKNRIHIPKPKIISRNEWNAKPPNFGYTSMPYYNKLTLHHAAGYSASSIEEGIIQMQAIQELHQDVRGWSDIGYHFVVDKAGNIYQARPETVIGAHTSDANTGNIGVCVLGCYHPPATSYFCYDEMTSATRDSLIKLYAWISEEYGYDNPHVLKGHRDYYDFEYTSCPGDNIWAMLPDLRDEITLYLEYGDIPKDFVLYQNYPNPFNGSTSIQFDVGVESNVTISVFDLLGRKVKTLTESPYYPGYNYKVQWDGKNERGEKMGSGIYIYRSDNGENTYTEKMILLK